MKNKIILSTMLVLAFSLPSAAIVTSSDMCNEETLQNRGYSKHMARLITIRSAQAAGEVPEIADEPDYRKNTNWIRKFFIYIDPALDDNFMLQHQIHPVPSVHDL